MEALPLEVSAAPAVDVPLLEGRELHKSYWLDEKEIHVLRGASFALRAGEMASLVGPSGCTVIVFWSYAARTGMLKDFGNRLNATFPSFISAG